MTYTTIRLSGWDLGGEMLVRCNLAPVEVEFPLIPRKRLGYMTVEFVEGKKIPPRPFSLDD